MSGLHFPPKILSYFGDQGAVKAIFHSKENFFSGNSLFRPVPLTSWLRIS